MTLYSEEAEVAVIGALLLDPSCLSAFDLSDREFYLPQTAAAYRAVVALRHERGEPVDILTVEAELLRHRVTAPTSVMLADWAARTPTAANVGHYAKIIRDHASKRRLCQAARVEAKRLESIDSAETYAELEKTLATLSNAYEVHAQADSVASLVAVVRPDIGKAQRVIPTGLQALDGRCGGIPAGLSVIAGRPSQGKSSLSRIIAMNVAEAGTPVGYVSLEESKAQLTTNLLITRARVDSEHVTRGELGPDERDRLDRAGEQLSKMPIFVTDDRPLTGEAACSRIRLMHARHKIGIAFVDYWNRLSLPAKQSLREEANGIVTMFSALSSRLGIPVVVVAQLNRDSVKEQRKPRLEDLKESGGWEEAANLVILCHREGFYKESEPQDEIDLLIAKSKTTRTGRVRAAWCGKYLWVGDEQPVVPKPVQKRIEYSRADWDL